MATLYSPKIVTDGLVLTLDAGNRKSYPGSGTTWNDLSGNNYTGSLIAGPTFDTANNGSISFDGTDDYTNLPLIHPYLTNNNIYTAECWFRIADTTQRFIWGQVDQNGFGDATELFEFGINSTANLQFSWSVTAPSNIIYTSTINTNTWYHAVAVKNSANVAVYLNGSLDTSIANASNIAGVSGSHNIGKPNTNVRYFSGKVAVTRFYNRALSATEILQNFNATRSRFGV